MLRPARRMLGTVAAALCLATLAGCTGAPEGAGGSPSPSAGSASSSATPSVTPRATPSSTPTADPTPSPPAPPAFDAAQFSITDPTSPWVVVNKLRPLSPVDYIPETVPAQVPMISNPDMRPAAAAALAAMFAVAASEGPGACRSRMHTGRSRCRPQCTIDWSRASARTSADAQSARPGFSEHQTGLAVDIVSFPATCSIQLCFGETPQGDWLAVRLVAVRLHPALPGRQIRHHRVHLRAVALPVRRP